MSLDENGKTVSTHSFLIFGKQSIYISSARDSAKTDNLNRMRDITKLNISTDTFLTVSKRDNKRQRLKVNENLINSKSNEEVIDTEYSD